MIDPTKITNYHLTVAELQEHILFWIFAAGHNGVSTAKGIDRFMKILRQRTEPGLRPFSAMARIDCEGKCWSAITHILGQSGLGCWRKRSPYVEHLVYTDIDLETCTVEQLERIKGIGPKTARCFLLHSREGFRGAGLDRHVLSFLRDNGIDAPQSTPPAGKRYKVLEEEFLRLCDEMGKTPAEFDLEIGTNTENDT